MEDLNWKRVEEIVDQLLELPKAKHKSYIEKTCAGNEALKSEVTLLLASINDSEGWLERPEDYQELLYEDIAKDLNQIGASDPLIGQVIGSYTIIEQLGHGGMGSVFLAERTDGAFEHRVAIKLIREGKASPDNIRRFEQERRILANLNHRGIAQLFDGGVTENGSPYLIMEYVEGVPITEYCNKHDSSLSHRLDLFKAVLKAVQYAHENAIIHRDLKPANILVSVDGKVKILDFGISKILDDPSGQPPHFTQARLLTPRYAAPEQIKQQAITTATDLYALGVLFYELLSGNHPYEQSDQTPYELEQRILSEVATPPSGNVSASHSIAARQLSRELDAIATKAIRKEPEERYRMAHELLEELENLQQGRPISVLKDSFSYRSRKFIQRNKRSLATVAAVSVVIIALVVFYTYRLTQERNVAQFQAQKAEVVTDFLIDLFEANDPGQSQGDTLTARHLLETGEQQLLSLDNQPAIQGELLEVLGNIYGLLSYPDKSDSLLLSAQRIKKELYTPEDPELASVYSSLATTKETLGDYEQALGLIDTSLQYKSVIYGPRSEEVGNTLRLAARNYRHIGQLDTAYKAITDARELFQTGGDTTESEYQDILMELGAITVAQGKLQEAEAIWRSSLQLSYDLFTPPHPKIMTNLNGLANALKEVDKFLEAEKIYQRSIKMTTRLYGKNHINTATTLNNLAGLYYYQDKLQQADKYYNEAYTLFVETLGEDHPHTISILYNMANLKVDMGLLGEAEPLYKKVIELDIKQFGEMHPNVASDYDGLANLYKSAELYDQAETYFNKALAIRREIYDNPDHPYILYIRRSLAELLVSRGHNKQAVSAYQELLPSFINTFGSDHMQVNSVAGHFAKLLEKQDMPVPADSLIIMATPAD